MRFFEELRRDLLEVVNLDTGKPIAKGVLRADKLFHGRYLDDLPDILVIWARDAPVSAVDSPKVGTVRGEYPGNRTGDHTRWFERVQWRRAAHIWVFSARVKALLSDGDVPPARINVIAHGIRLDQFDRSGPRRIGSGSATCFCA